MVNKKSVIHSQAVDKVIFVSTEIENVPKILNY